MSFLCPLHCLLCIFHGLFRVLVPRLVIFFPVVHSGCPVRVRRKLVEFGSSLVRIILHAGLPSITCASRGSFHSGALCQEKARNCRQSCLCNPQALLAARIHGIEPHLQSGQVRKNSLLKKFFQDCTILNSIPRAQSIRYALDGETERY